MQITPECGQDVGTAPLPAMLDHLSRVTTAVQPGEMTRDGERLPEMFDETTAAALLGVSRDWLARQARQGFVPHYRVGASRRFTEAHLAAYLAAREVVPVDPWARVSHSPRRRRRG